MAATNKCLAQNSKSCGGEATKKSAIWQPTFVSEIADSPGVRMTKPTMQAAGDAALALHALRKRRAMSQKQLAVMLAVRRSAVCKLERRTDMRVSNLRRYIEALGGTLEITARFPDGAVAIAVAGEPPA